MTLITWLRQKISYSLFPVPTQIRLELGGENAINDIFKIHIISLTNK